MRRALLCSSRISTRTSTQYSDGSYYNNLLLNTSYRLLVHDRSILRIYSNDLSTYRAGFSRLLIED